MTVVADAGMRSEANLTDLEDAGLTFIVAAKIPNLPYEVKHWQREHPGQPITDQQIFTQPTIMGPRSDRQRRTIYYQYRADRAPTNAEGHR